MRKMLIGMVCLILQTTLLSAGMQDNLEKAFGALGMANNVTGAGGLILLPFVRQKEESYRRRKTYNSGGLIDENLR